MIPSFVTLVEVGPRDGLQNEAQPVPAAVKIELVHRLQAAGCREIEVTSVVSPNSNSFGDLLASVTVLVKLGDLPAEVIIADDQQNPTAAAAAFQTLRDAVLSTKIRIDGRNLDTVRQISARTIGVEGFALFFKLFFR